MSKHAWLLFMVLGAGAVPAAMAAGRCPAGDMGCTQEDYEQKVKDRVEQGKKDVKEASGPIEKVKAVGNTVKDCADCGMKVIKDAIKGAGKDD
ncbi:MAG: hypothetical protein ACT6Q9_11405 [Polaromonas sp.]|uniref:hypothetical protein n=1 Tax=Polaromonas sp. TaxID=1869339 RepID=UPI0040367306